MKLLITDSVTVKSNNDISLDIFKEFGEVVQYDNITRAELLKAVCDVDIILCNKTVIDKDIIEKANKLKYIGLFATGYNNIDIKTAKERKIVVCNAGSYSTNAVAQQVIGYILMHYTSMHKYDEFVKKGGWKSSEVFSPLVFSADEVFGKTLGIVGYGSIGKAVEKAALGLGMKVLVYTRTPKADENAVFVGFDELLSNSDIISMHCPLNAQSQDLMNKSAFEKCKDGAFFINTSRGGVVDEYALADALKSGKLSGAAVDVLRSEPMAEDCPLQEIDNIIITPHTAWAPLTTRKRLLDIVMDNIRAFLADAPKNNVIE